MRAREEPKGKGRIVHTGRSEHNEGFHGRRQDQVNKEEQRTKTKNKEERSPGKKKGPGEHSLPSHIARVLKTRISLGTQVLETQDASFLHSFTNKTTN